VTCPEEGCNKTYVGETGRCLNERVKDHVGRDTKSHYFKHSITTGHPSASIEDFDILSGGYRQNKFRRKLSEALFIKDIKPNLNVQEQSYQLKLFS